MKNTFSRLKTNINEIPLNIWLTAFVSLSVLFLVLMNLFATRPIGIGSIQVTNAGLILIAPVLVLQNVITEVWGKKTAFKVTLFAIVCQIFIVCLIQIIIILPTNETGIGMSESWASAFGSQWRIVISSILAFAFGSFFNIVLFAKIREESKRAKEEKEKYHGYSRIVKGRYKYLYVLAAFVSTAIAQFIDSTIFMVLAFAPVGIPNTFELGWQDILTSIGIGTAVQLLLETTIVAIIAVHLAKWLKRKKDPEYFETIITQKTQEKQL
ncbi:MAG: queuosine precursor transporter [Firmicutes bacterium]|nr:queuosine precursor transporter [Bacillota bacterium]